MVGRSLLFALRQQCQVRRAMSVFISYRRASQRAFALNLRTLLQQELRTLGMLSWEEVFLDERSIDPGQQFEQRLENEIVSCDLFVAVVDREYFGERFHQDGDFVRTELLIASRAKRIIVPIVLDSFELPPKATLPAWAVD